MTWALVAVGGGALLGAGASIYGSSQAADAAQNASQAQVQAAHEATQAQLGIYNTTRNDLAPYNLTGQYASNALSSFMGLPGTPITAGLPSGAGGGANGANVDSPTTLNNIKQGLQSWNTAMPGNAQPIIDMINNGANLQQVQSALQSLSATTTNPRNTAFLNPLIQQASNPVNLPLSGFGQQPPGGAGAPGTPPGTNAFNPTAQLENWPGYQFMRDQGQLGVARQNAAGGRYLSGAQLKGAEEFGSNYALSGAVQPYLSNLQYLSSLGENAGAVTGNAGTQTGQGVASSIMSGGTAAGSGFVGAANAFNSGVSGVNGSIQGAIQNQLLSGLLTRGGGGGGLPITSGTGYGSAYGNAFGG